MNYLQNAVAFLINTIFGFFIGVFLVRLMLIAVGAPFNEPICRFVYQLTNPVITPLRRFVPRWRRIELSSLLVAWLLVVLELVLFTALLGAHFGAVGLLLRSLADTVDWAVLIQLVAIFVRCLLSFVVSERYNPNMQLLVQFTEPVVRPFRRLLPALGGMDFSCWFASIALILVRMLILAPLADLAPRLP
jgi:YggT family protein